jgi:hypothetical protein
MDELIDIKKSLKDRIITKMTFLDNSVGIKLTDVVFLYNDTQDWKAIPLKIAQMYPLIYDSYYENKNALPITVYICPYTLFSCVYFDEMISYDKVYNNNLVITNKKNDIVIPILNNIYSATQVLTEKYIRRNEVKIMTVRNAISLYPDCQFVNIKNIEEKTPIVNEAYLSNDAILFDIEKPASFKTHDPKLLIYVIEYRSKKTHEFKYTVLIPKKKTFDISKNGLHQYLDKMYEKITEKSGFIYPCLWFAWITSHPSSKIIKL